MAIQRAVRVHKESVSDAIGRLEAYVRRQESRYECSSDFVAEATKGGHMKETAEIGRWLASYRMLTSLKEARNAGNGTGTRTKTTR